jgi:hypothetical protein
MCDITSKTASSVVESKAVTILRAADFPSETASHTIGKVKRNNNVNLGLTRKRENNIRLKNKSSGFNVVLMTEGVKDADTAGRARS